MRRLRNLARAVLARFRSTVPVASPTPRPWTGGSGFLRHHRRRQRRELIRLAAETASGRYEWQDSQFAQLAALARAVGASSFLLTGETGVAHAPQAYAASSMMNQLANAIAGLKCISGGLLQPGTNAGTLKLNPGFVDLNGSLTYVGGASGAAQDNIACLNGGSPPVVPDSTNPMWVLVEVQGSTTLSFVAGSPAVSPIMPQPSGTYPVAGWLYVMPSAVTITTTLSDTGATEALLSDARWLFKESSTGWRVETHTWTRASNTQFTISSATNFTGIFTKGARLLWYESGTAKYGAVASSSFASSTTTVNLIATSDYVMAATVNSTASATFYSYQSPPDWPTWFNHTPTFSGWTSTPTGYVSRWSCTGNQLIYYFYLGLLGGNLTSNSTTTTTTLPVAAVNHVSVITAPIGGTPSQTSSGPGYVQVNTGSGPSTAAWSKDYAGTAFASSGNKYGTFTLVYDF